LPTCPGSSSFPRKHSDHDSLPRYTYKIPSDMPLYPALGHDSFHENSLKWSRRQDSWRMNWSNSTVS
jgi:hypothetical protein